ncbi:zinc-dependent metalloprotease [Halorubrum vacuolatum]|nr:zinc-dependent metalloprotease [Halorubrum vacuolatum]
MDVLRSLRAVAEASGTGVIDWEKAAEAAKASTEPGSLDLTPAEREGYAADVRDARRRVGEVSGLNFEVPGAVEVQNRHHWIDANVDTLRNVMRPIEGAATPLLPDLSRIANTGSLAFTLGFLGRNVLGQYDPLLLADEPAEDHGLYFVHPNITAAASELDLPYPRFRRWIAFHEVTHAAEFGAAPWLPEYLESRLESGIQSLTAGGLDPGAFAELQVAMTAVEGYAELLMDRAFDREYADLRRKLDERRSGGTPIERFARRLLGLGMKRRQYERGAAFFEAVADARGIEAAGVVWSRPEYLPTNDELDHPETWLLRVDP